MEAKTGLQKWKEVAARAADWFVGLFGTSKILEGRQDKIARRKAAQAKADRDGTTKRYRWDKATVSARTKSEARARLKVTLGLDRLPPGANVMLLGEVAKAEVKAPPAHVKPRCKRNKWRWKFVPWG